MIDQTDDELIKVELYINIAWANLTHYRVCENEFCLSEAKSFLDLSLPYFDNLERRKKKLIYINYSDYYYLSENYEKAIEMLNKAKENAEERVLPQIYLKFNNIELVNKYLNLSETLAAKYSNYFEVAQSLYFKGQSEMQEGDFFRAKDAFYVALENYIRVKNYTYAFKCFSKIIEIEKSIQLDCITSLSESLKRHFENTPFYEQI
ncbi:MAG: hypothetical protein KAX49_18600 [Halanaerobiales bacterium]|nr:hypothetical protein [Halanaerobiales bacterium]